MQIFSRLKLVFVRALRANTFGVRFFGTSAFRMPETIRLHGIDFPISAPVGDDELKYDFINIWLDDEYLLSAVPRPHRVVDVGANIGLFSLWAYKTFGAIALQVYEPNVSLHDHLERNLSPIPNTGLLAEAVGGGVGWIELAKSVSSRDTRSIVAHDLVGERIPMVGLARLVERAGGVIDLLKLDCEGAEWDILTDSASLRYVKYIVMEYHLFGGQHFEDLKGLMSRAGFVLKYHNEGKHIAHFRNLTKIA